MLHTIVIAHAWAKVNNAPLISSDSITNFFDSESNAISKGKDFPTVNPIDPVSYSLSVPLSSFAHNVSVPMAVLQGKWKKATELINKQNKIASTPGCSPLSRMVESKSGGRLHLVTEGKGGTFICDSFSANYKAFKICSYVVAVANVNQLLPSFINTFQRQKKSSNLTSLATADMPRDRGCKGGKPPCKKKKTDAPEIKVPFNPVSSMDTSLSPSTNSSQFCGSSFLDSSSQEMLSISQLHGSLVINPGNQPSASSNHQQFTPVPPPLTSVVTAANVNLQTISGGTCNIIFSNTAVTTSNANT